MFVSSFTIWINHAKIDKTEFFMKKITSLLFILYFVLSSVTGQKFTGFKDTANFPHELSDILGSDLQQGEVKLITDFSTSWQGDMFSLTEKGEIIRLAGIMYERKARSNQFKSFISALVSTKIRENNQENYTLWMRFLLKYIVLKQTTITKLTNFFENTIDLSRDNFLINSSSVQWKYVGSNFKFKLENDILTANFEKGNLHCYSKRDSILINETSGIYNILERKWRGKGGLVTWERAGFNPQEVNARLNRYSIELNRSEYKADSVMFTYGKYFSNPVMGQVTDKVMNILSVEQAIYPEFITYSKRYFFKNIYPNIDYDGGFTMKGAKIIGSGIENDLAKIIIKNGPKILMEVRSKYFVLRPDRINGLNSLIKIYLEHDSIYHTDLAFTYFVKSKEVNLLRTEEYSSQSPYYDTYHKIDMDFEELSWRIDQPFINLAMARGSASGRARFESLNYFNMEQFEKLQGMNDTNPLVSIRNYGKRFKNEEFPGAGFADYLVRQVNEVRQLLMEMAKKGFIYYDSQTDVVKIKQRLHDYLNSSFGKTDFDVMDFISSTQAPLENASLDMATFDLKINGIPKIAVSDSQNVFIYPAREQIILKQDRSFQFDGVIEVGLLTFYGNNFFFDYKNFKFNLQNVDSVSIKVNTSEVDNFGRPKTRRVNNVIEHLTGDLRIDKPDNKSGRKNYPEYPLFASRENSQVYYQRKDIENGVYPEESFYFEVYPFLLDSLDNFKKEGLQFLGKFQSAGILPPMEQKLTLQPDYSLGFKFNPGPDGIPVYEGKAKLIANIQLSNNGLRADGKFEYLTSTTTSKDFKLYPDSMNTQSVDFTIAEQTGVTQFPNAGSKENYVHWLPKNDIMFIKQAKEPFQMFNDHTNLVGNLTLQPKGLSGNGTMNLTAAELQSKNFRYKAKIIDADTSKFLLKSLHKEGYTVLTNDNVKSHIDFVSQKGEFNSNEDYTKVEFPENKYLSYLDYFKWNMIDKTLEMGAKRIRDSQLSDTAKTKFRTQIDEKYRFEEEPIGPRYISTNYKQDSINFVAPSAIYDYQNNLILASEVKLIRVADAIIYPIDGKVTIAEAAQMKTLFKTKIVANYIDRFHTIYDADVNIQGRNVFTGVGKYDYIDETTKAQVVDLTEIKVDKDLHTVAKGKKLETDDFTLSPNFGFQGSIRLNSTKQLLTFDGGASIRTDCPKLKPSWLKFESEIDPKVIYIPVEENPLNINNNKIFAGIFLAPDSIHIYPAFLSPRHGYNDQYIVTSSGYLYFNKDSMKYEIASKEKLLYNDTTGNYLSLHKFNCIEYGEGKINLAADLGQIKLSSYGNASFNLINGEVNLDIFLGIDFLFDQNAMHLLANKIDSFPNLKGVDITRNNYLKSMNEIIGKKRSQKYLEDVSVYGKPKEFPTELQHTLNITHLKLKWNEETNSYQSFGKIGIGNILNYQVNKEVEGYIEIVRKRSGDLMDIYLKLDDKNYFYFGYTRGTMQAYSSNTEFVEILKKLSLKVRNMDTKRGQTPYSYMVTSDTKFGAFLRNYKQHMKGELNIPEEKPIEIPEVSPQVQPSKPPGDQPAVTPANQPSLPETVPEKQKTDEKKKEIPKEETPVIKDDNKEGEVIEVK